MSYKRLDAVLSASGMTRNEAHKLIKTKKTAVNGITVNDIAFRVGDNDEITVEGKKLDREKFIYLILNKPAGYVSTTEDGNDSIMRLIPQEYRRKGLSPAGRLDKDSEGLLLLSDDGDFIHRIISPKKSVDKLYWIELALPLDDKMKESIASGLTLSDGEVCAPADIVAVTESTSVNAAEIMIHEGKYHQVKRMLAAVGNKVTRLVRLRVGSYTLDGIAPGELKRFYPQDKE